MKMIKNILIVSLLLLAAVVNVSGMDSEQADFGPIMSSQKLFDQKNELESWIRIKWQNCLMKLEEKFLGLTVKDNNQSYLIIKSDFEKLPRTEDNVLFIKETVQYAINRTPVFYVELDSQIKKKQEKMLKGILERMMVNALVESLLQDTSKSLDWCICTAEYKRIALALLIVNEAREKFQDKNKRIVHTSLASGDLLQDYIILSELLLSHTRFLVNIIDLDYPDIPALAKNNLSLEKPTDLHTIEMKTKQESAKMIDNFKVKMAQVISERSGNYKFEVNIYENAYDYITRVQRNPDEKSNILIMVDPSVGAFGTADFPALANVINIWIDGEDACVFTIYMPRHHPAQLYQVAYAYVADPKIIQSIHDQLRQWIKSTGADKRYTPQLTEEFLARDMNIGRDKIVKKVSLTAIFPRFMQKRAELEQEALEEEAIFMDMIQPLTPVKLGDVPVLLSWGTDAHISFQDLVWDVLAPNAIVYQLYQVDLLLEGSEKDKIIKINPEVYKKKDVITPNSGLNAGYKREL